MDNFRGFFTLNVSRAPFFPTSAHSVYSSETRRVVRRVIQIPLAEKKSMVRKILGSTRSSGGLLFAAPIALLLMLAPVVQNQNESRLPTGITLHKLSTDTFTNNTSQHATEVEPDTFSFGSTIVATHQTGRFFDGGSSDIGYVTSKDGGITWTNGFLPGITNIQHPGNPYDRDSDPSVAYDPKHNVWMISSLPIVDSGANIPAVIVSRSTDGGTTWGNPVSVTPDVFSSDKDWIVCDTWATS